MKAISDRQQGYQYWTNCTMAMIPMTTIKPITMITTGQALIWHLSIHSQGILHHKVIHHKVALLCINTEELQHLEQQFHPRLKRTTVLRRSDRKRSPVLSF